MSLGMVLQAIAASALALGLFGLLFPRGELTRARSAGVVLIGTGIFLSGAKLDAAGTEPATLPAPLLASNSLKGLVPRGDRLFATATIGHGDDEPLIPAIAASVRELSARLPVGEGGQPIRTARLTVSVVHDHAGAPAQAPLVALEYDAVALRRISAGSQPAQVLGLARSAAFSGNAAGEKLLRQECLDADAAVRKTALCAPLAEPAAD